MPTRDTNINEWTDREEDLIEEATSTPTKKPRKKKEKVEKVEEVVDVECSSCHRTIKKADSKLSVGGRFVCQRCFDYRYFVCKECGSVKARDRERMNMHNDKVLCDSCFAKYFVKCRNCGNNVKKGDEKVSRDGVPYCQKCYKDIYFLCAECGEESLMRNRKINAEGKNICNACYMLHQPKWGSALLAPDLRKVHAVGIEVECYPKENIDQLAMKYTDVVPYYHLGHDGSLHSGGVEMTTIPIPIEKLEKVMMDSGEFLSNFVAKRECGLHIHLNMYPYIVSKDATVQQIGEVMKKLLIGFWRLEKYLFSAMPPTRRDNTYCRKITQTLNIDEDPEALVDLPPKKIPQYFYGNFGEKRNLPFGNKSHDTRYCWLNIHSLIFRNTLEIRLHTGSVNEKKMYLWCMAMSHILQWIMSHDIEDINDLKPSTLPKILKPEELSYLEERRHRFEKGSQPKVTVPYVTARAGNWGFGEATGVSGIYVVGNNDKLGGESDFIDESSKAVCLDINGSSITKYEYPRIVGALPLNLKHEESE